MQMYLIQEIGTLPVDCVLCMTGSSQVLIMYFILAYVLYIKTDLGYVLIGQK
jgi:hypothetical protein